MGSNLAPIDLGSGRSLVQIVGGIVHSCALLDNGSVKCWGDNSNGELGLGDTNARGDTAGEMATNLLAVDLGTGRSASFLAGGYHHVCALLDNGSMKCWGMNASGQLGLGDADNRGDAPGEMGDNLPAVDLGTGRTAVAMVAGSDHTCALLDNGVTKCWGYSNYGQLGQGDTTNRGDAAGQMGDNLPTVDLGTGRSATALAGGAYHTCAILDNGSVKCWGLNIFGQLGLGDTTPRGDFPGRMGDNLPAVDFGTGRSAGTLVSSAYHTCAILDNSSLKCWGSNDFGQLGLGDTSYRGDRGGQMGDSLPTIDLGIGRTATEVSLGAFHTCATLDNGGTKCWGRNDVGMLGLGDTNHRGDAANEMGDNLLAVDL